MADKLNPNLEALQRLCSEAVSYVKLALKMKRLKCEDAYQSIKSTDLLAIAACIVELARHLREAYCSLYGVEDGNKLFEGLINGINMDNRKERG